MTTPVLEQYKRIKSEYPDEILFFRLGDFYEMFYEDAEVAAKELEIALTARNKGKDSEAPMCGIPVKAAEEYIADLINKGFKVAICEQVGDPDTSSGPVDREVVRVVTPGTAVDENVLTKNENNFIASICTRNGAFGTAFVDISTGKFVVSQPDSREEVSDQLHQYQPSEIIHPEEETDLKGFDSFSGQSLFSSLDNLKFRTGEAERKLKNHFEVEVLDGFGLKNKTAAVSAAGAMISYLEETQKRQLQHIKNITFSHSTDYMVLDTTTQRNLELFEPLISGRNHGTLFSILDKTQTAMGGRALRSRIMRPLIEKDKIEKRLEATGEFKEKVRKRESLREKLKNIYDIERLLSRISLSTAKPKDLTALKSSLRVLPSIAEICDRMQSRRIKTLNNELDILEDVAELIENAIMDNPAAALKEGGIIKDGFDEDLDELREISRGGKEHIAEIEAREKERTGIETLKVGHNKVHGYYIEVTKAKTDQVPDNYTRKQPLLNSERYITQELKDYETKIFSAEEKINDLEYEIFQDVRNRIAEESERIQKTAGILAKLDVLSALAELASRNKYKKPEIREDKTLDIKQGRHPVVEELSEESFVPNDTYMDDGENHILIMTGPNMGGKSTYLRQVALITLMAQMGSFVPADNASIGIVDRIFTRVGASDNLVEGQSTYMVEMTETANILNNATPESLIILDEVGRGTSTFDGVSLAWAVVEYLHRNSEISGKTLFATHYHELTDLASLYKGIKNLKITAKEWKDEIVFLHRVEEGSADRSYGIQVAKLAGIPGKVIERAGEILQKLEEEEFNEEGIPVMGAGGSEIDKNPQPTLFDDGESEVERKLKDLDLNNLTPLEALNILSDLKEKAQER